MISIRGYLQSVKVIVPLSIAPIITICCDALLNYISSYGSHLHYLMDFFVLNNDLGFTGDESKANKEARERFDKWTRDLSGVSDFVAAIQYDDFHKNSGSVFGIDKKSGKIYDRLIMKQNHMLIIGIDIKSFEAKDVKTRTALQESVQQAIEITTEAQQSLARQEASRVEQQAHGKLDRQIVNNNTE